MPATMPRGHESPMDFEWQTAGPADPTSPFYRLTANYQKMQEANHGQKRKASFFLSFFWEEKGGQLLKGVSRAFCVIFFFFFLKKKTSPSVLQNTQKTRERKEKEHCCG